MPPLKPNHGLRKVQGKHSTENLRQASGKYGSSCESSPISRRFLSICIVFYHLTVKATSLHGEPTVRGASSCPRQKQPAKEAISHDHMAQVQHRTPLTLACCLTAAHHQRYCFAEVLRNGDFGPTFRNIFLSPFCEENTSFRRLVFGVCIVGLEVPT